ncbi:MAG TPA: GNAT family N-acetyltransferase [Azospirillaceae bacterium]|nr:GNAT family N-acetyltransferase [Azospirillaceae bacterium]
MEPNFRVSDEADPALRDSLLQGLRSFNDATFGPSAWRLLSVAHTDPATGEVLAGLWGRTSYGWLYVELLYVSDRLRGTGIGPALLRAAEEEAVRRGCGKARLDTFGLRNRAFYEKHGYTVYAELGDFPPGDTHFYLMKTLADAQANA